MKERAYLITRPGGSSVTHTGTSYSTHEGVLTIWGLVPNGMRREHRNIFWLVDVPAFLHTPIVSYAPGTWERIEVK